LVDDNTLLAEKLGMLLRQDLVGGSLGRQRLHGREPKRGCGNLSNGSQRCKFHPTLWF
jgi:hypothetical protein